MTRLPYQRPTPDHLGYWRVAQPISPLDIELWYKRSGYEHIRFLVHGIPCNPSPEWEERHPGEAAVGEATYPYNAHKQSFRNALSIVRQFLWTGNTQGFDLDPGADVATNFANLLIGATDEDCWEQVFWMDIVDYDRPYRAPTQPTIKPLKPSLRKRIAQYVTKKGRKLK